MLCASLVLVAVDALRAGVTGADFFHAALCSASPPRRLASSTSRPLHTLSHSALKLKRGSLATIQHRCTLTSSRAAGQRARARDEGVFAAASRACTGAWKMGARAENTRCSKKRVGLSLAASVRRWWWSPRRELTLSTDWRRRQPERTMTNTLNPTQSSCIDPPHPPDRRWYRRTSHCGVRAHKQRRCDTCCQLQAIALRSTAASQPK